MKSASRLANLNRQTCAFSASKRLFSSKRMAELNINSKYLLPTGHEIPLLGYGVYQTPAEVTEDVVLRAFKAGYRHVDSARVYRNEQPCSDAIKKSGIPRSEIFLTSKVPPRSMGYEETKKSIQSSFAQTGLDYIDLQVFLSPTSFLLDLPAAPENIQFLIKHNRYLIHAPYGGKEARSGSWRALVEAQKAGKIRSLGVSNYGVHHLDELEAYIQELEKQHGEGNGGQISVGQWELHPWLPRPDIVQWCEQRGIVREAYCPIVRGQRFDDPSLQSLAKKYGKTAAQILIRWSLQKGFVPLPKSVTPSRIRENADVFDFALTPDEVSSLETKEYSPCSWDPTVSQD